MAERRVLTEAEVAEWKAALLDPDYIRRLTEDAKTAGHVEVDNPMRREVRPRRGTDEGGQR